MAEKFTPAPSIEGAPARLTMRGFWRALADEMFSSDRGIPWTFWRLTTSPGETIRSFVIWRNPKVTRPLRYFLVGFGLVALLFQAYNDTKSFEDIIRSGFGSAGGSALLILLSHVLWLVLITVVPAVACALRLAYSRYQPTFAEMWVFAVYVIAHLLLIIALSFGILFVPLKGWPLRGDVEAVILFCLPPSYLIAACLGYFPEPGLGRVLRAVCAVALSGGLIYAFAGSILIGAFKVGEHWPELIPG